MFGWYWWKHRDAETKKNHPKYKNNTEPKKKVCEQKKRKGLIWKEI